MTKRQCIELPNEKAEATPDKQANSTTNQSQSKKCLALPKTIKRNVVLLFINKPFLEKDE